MKGERRKRLKRQEIKQDKEGGRKTTKRRRRRQKSRGGSDDRRWVDQSPCRHNVNRRQGGVDNPVPLFHQLFFQRHRLHQRLHTPFSCLHRLAATTTTDGPTLFLPLLLDDFFSRLRHFNRPSFNCWQFLPRSIQSLEALSQWAKKKEDNRLFDYATCSTIQLFQSKKRWKERERER